MEKSCFLNNIDSSISFSAANSDSGKYVAMFPNSTIAKSFQQKAKKVKYMVEFGIAMVLEQLMK